MKRIGIAAILLAVTFSTVMSSPPAQAGLAEWFELVKGIVTPEKLKEEIQKAGDRLSDRIFFENISPQEVKGVRQEKGENELDARCVKKAIAKGYLPVRDVPGFREADTALYISTMAWGTVVRGGDNPDGSIDCYMRVLNR